jgi:hypothetical protein
MSPFFKNEKDRCDNEPKANEIVPFHLLFEIVNGKDAEDHESNHFLNGLQLGPGEGAGSYPICWNLKAILEKCDQPTDKNYLPEGYVFEFQMPVPGKGHKNVGYC